MALQVATNVSGWVMTRSPGVDAGQLQGDVQRCGTVHRRDCL
jgi:hypothetical protein